MLARTCIRRRGMLARAYSQLKVDEILESKTNRKTKQHDGPDPFHVRRAMEEGRGGSTNREKAIFDSLLSALFNQNKDRSAERLGKRLRDGDEVEITEGQAEGKKHAVAESATDFTKAKLAPVLEHLRALPTDQQVLDYYIENVVERSHLLQQQELDHVQAASPPITPQSVPIYLDAVLRQLIEVFESPTAANAVFELSKRASVYFYGASCNTSVYNRMVSMKWMFYRDFYAIESLLSEMNINAVRADEGTLKVLERISSDFERMKRQGSLWNKEDVSRMTKLNKYRFDILKQLNADNVRRLNEL